MRTQQSTRKVSFADPIDDRCQQAPNQQDEDCGIQLAEPSYAPPSRVLKGHGHVLQWTCYVDRFRRFLRLDSEHNWGNLQSIHISPQEKALIQTASFGIFLDIGEFPMSRNLLLLIMKQWVKELVFNFKGKEVRFSESDVTLLLGLPNHGEIIPTLEEAREATCEGYMKAKFFPDGAAPSRTQIEDIMIQVHGSNNPEDIEDFCRLYILYVFSCILFYTPEYRVLGYLLGYVDNLNDINGRRFVD
ncbi:hypothetical protein Cni_G28623 [Canna indica]|uniref:Aminotransferase-like plant mobile domain-containing protein n=1 Tax=Canna indica TaxID=4628 RepID=A0AAQ3QNY2_9LILI|nr:hypothetical protein Cni_G28623 [Canna indica]